MHFGKRFIITASLSSYFLFSAFPSLASEIGNDYPKAVEYAYSEITKAKKRLNEKFIECQKGTVAIKASTIRQKLPDIPGDKTGQKLANAIVFLSGRNLSQCTKFEDAYYIYLIYSAKQLISRGKDGGEKINSPHTSLINELYGASSFPIHALQKVEYMTLPKDIRDKFESIEEFKHIFRGMDLVLELEILKYP